MFTKLATKMFGSKNAREIKRMRKVVTRINELEEQFGALSDTELQGKTAEFRRRLDEGEALDSLLPEVFATVREASRRVAKGRTGRALRRSTTKLSARCIRKRENLSAMIPSISSICLIFMLIRHCAAGRTKLSGLRPWQPRAPPARRRKGS